MKKSYVEYLKDIMALPKGAPTPAYVPGEPQPHLRKSVGIFDIIEADYNAKVVSKGILRELNGESEESTDDTSDYSDEDDMSSSDVGLPMPTWASSDDHEVDELAGL
jgi:hypothetical protein